MKSLITIITIMFSSVVFAGSHFETGSSKPTSELVSELKKVYLEKIKDKQVDSVVVEGHTDSRGSDKSNQKLSLARAKAAAQKLIEMGVDKNKITAVGKGESELLSLGQSDLDHSKNRRVVVVVGSNEGESKTVISEHKCPQDIVREKEIVVKKHKQILSLTVNRSLTDYDISNPSPNSTRVENRFELAPGIMYQNNITNDVYLGVQFDTHKGVGGSIGYGW